METIIVAIIALIITYFIIKGAVESAIDEKMKKHLTSQTEYLKYLAQKAGMPQEENSTLKEKTPWWKDKPSTKKE